MRISDWSSDVCSSDLPFALRWVFVLGEGGAVSLEDVPPGVSCLLEDCFSGLRATTRTAFVAIRAIAHQRLIEPEVLGAFGRSLYQFILTPYLDVRKCLHVFVFGDDDTIHGGRAGRKYPDVIIAFEAILRKDPVAALSPEVINDRPVAEGFPAGLSVGLVEIGRAHV